MNTSGPQPLPSGAPRLPFPYRAEAEVVSASLAALQGAVQAAGGLDRLVLAVDGEHGEAVFSAMCAVLTLLPSLRRRQAPEIELICLPGKAATSLVQFTDRIRPQLSGRGVGVSLEMLAEPVDRSPA